MSVFALLALTQVSAAPGRNWAIAFHRDMDVWVADGDGSHQHRLIRNAECPCWSSDKRKIAFIRRNAVWVAWADGSHQRRIAGWKGPKPDWPGELASEQGVGITWGPADPFLILSEPDLYRTRSVAGGVLWGTSICSVGLAGQDSDLQGLASLASEDPYAFSQNAYPALDPSGQKLAFACNGDVWLAVRREARGRPSLPRGINDYEWDEYRIAAPAQFDYPNYRASRENYGVTHLSWSPDGRSLAYGIQRIGGSGFWEVHLLNLRYNTALARPEVSRDCCLATDGCAPTFSPDGKSIAYLGETGDDGLDGIRLIRLSDGKSRVLIKDADQPAW